MNVSCQCGYVTFKTPTAQPLAIYHCHCLECRKQSASAFGTTVLFPATPLFPLAPDLAAKLKVWTRPTDAGNSMDCYFCPECGVRLMHRVKNADGSWRQTISLKGGVLEDLDWSTAGAKHIFCRSAVVDLPDDAEKWEAEPDGMVARK
jgi:hypothetical protein